MISPWPARIEVVVHCYGDLYRRMLREQLKSLATLPDAATVSIRVHHAIGDSAAYDTVQSFKRSPNEQLHVYSVAQDAAMLRNRNIGRNYSAQRCTADWMWFADCDYLFGPGSMDALARLPRYYLLAFPRQVRKSTFFFDDLEEGAPVPYDQCTASGVPRAIGGLQIVPGIIARTCGYLPDNKWQQPVQGDKFADTKGDQVFRAMLGTPGAPVDIPGVYRLRHRIPQYSARHKLLPAR